MHVLPTSLRIYLLVYNDMFVLNSELNGELMLAINKCDLYEVANLAVNASTFEQSLIKCLVDKRIYEGMESEETHCSRQGK